MANILTGNILLTKSRAVIETLRSSTNISTSLEDKRLSLTDEQYAESFIVSPNTNNGLIRFEFSLGYMGNTHAILELVETSELLELFLMNNDPMAKLITSKTSTEKSEIYEATRRDVNEGLDTRSKVEKAYSLLKASNDFYITFGTGDDMSKWAGPYKIYLGTATLKYTPDNVRTIVAKFIPYPGTYKIWSKRFNEEFGYAKVVDNYNEMLSRGDYISAEGRVYVHPEDPDADNLDLNKRVRDVLRDYISKVTKNTNVVLVLPNDIKIPDSYQKAYNEAKENIKKVKTAERLSQTRTSLNSSIASMELSVLLGRSGDGIVKLAPKKAETLDAPLDPISESVLKVLGINTIKYTSNGFADMKLEPVVFNPNVTGEDTLENIIVGGFELSMGFHAEIGGSNNDPTPFQRPLYTFCGGLKQLYPDRSSQRFTFYEETDLRILKLWAELGIIEDSNKPAVVFGDKDEIYKLLYLNWYTPSLGDVAPKDINTTWSDSLYYLLSELPRPLPNYSAYNSTGVTPSNEYVNYSNAFISEFGLKRSITDNSSFQELDTPTDNIELKELYKSDLVFKHNIRNPNIIDFEYSVDNAILSLLDVAIDARIPGSVITSTTSPLVADIITGSLGDKFVANIREIFEKDIGSSKLSESEQILVFLNDKPLQTTILDTLSSKILNNPELGELTRLDIAVLIVYLRKLDQNSPPGSPTLTTTSGRYAEAYAAAYKRLQGISVMADITTLPLFTSRVYMGKSCSLVGINNHILGTRTSTDLAPYTGKYDIRGITHVIEPDNLYSKFDLVRSNYNATKSLRENTSVKVKDLVLSNLREELYKLERIPEYKTADSFSVGSMFGKVNELYYSTPDPTKSKRIKELKEQISKIEGPN